MPYVGEQAAFWNIPVAYVVYVNHFNIYSALDSCFKQVK